MFYHAVFSVNGEIPDEYGVMAYLGPRWARLAQARNEPENSGSYLKLGRVDLVGLSATKDWIL